MIMQHIETIQGILEEAGLIHAQRDVPVVLNDKTVQLPDQNIADSNHNDLIDFEDVQVFIDGAAAQISHVDEERGTVTLETVPKEYSDIRATYNYSPVRVSSVERVRGEVKAEVLHKAGRGIYEKHQEIIRYIVRLMAAGRLLIRDYGLNPELEDTSKDGYKKIELAERKLAELIDEHSGARNALSIEARDDGDLFTRRNRPYSERF